MLRVALVGSHSEICFQAHGRTSIATSSVKARPMAMTATRCTGVKVSKRIVLNQQDWYNEFKASIACLAVVAKQFAQAIRLRGSLSKKVSLP
jgi:hypothetical protein